MSKPPKAENFFIDGPAGKLEVLVESPRDTSATGAAVVCHPHPEHGGTMQNKVVHTLARAFVARGFATMRFNFRGVGRSEGTFDDGKGELQDALAAVQTMQNRGVGTELWVAGFSFGAAIAILTATEAGADGLVSVAPAISRLTNEAGRQPDCPWLVVQGERDDLVDVADTIDWVNGLAPGPELVIFEDTEHYFHGRLVKLRETVEAFIDEQRAET